MMNIEEKLSAIKAINEEKDYCEKSIDKLSAFDGADSMSFFSGGSPNAADKQFIFPAQVTAKVVVVLSDYYQARKLELIEQAKELIK